MRFCQSLTLKLPGETGADEIGDCGKKKEFASFSLRRRRILLKTHLFSVIKALFPLAYPPLTCVVFLLARGNVEGDEVSHFFQTDFLPN